MTRRIGLLTFHHIVNEGAILQTYALFERLKALFPRDVVEVIDYRSLSAEKGYIKQAFQLTRRPGALLGGVSRYFNTKRFIRQRLNLSSASIKTDDYDRSLAFLKTGKYDLIVVGSDEIWKIEGGAFARTFPNIYWLGDGLGGMKVAYAASANKLEYREVNGEQRAWMSEALGRFDLLGVRDNHTMDMLRHFQLPKAGNVHKVPDPTFMMTLPDLSLGSKLRKFGIDPDKPMVGITFDAAGVSEPLLGHFRSRGYQTVAITAFNRFADFNLAGRLNPLEWAVIFKYFSFSFTSLFHGTIFSMKNHCPFLSFDYFSASRYETKLQCLLRELDMQDRYVPAQGRTLSVEAIVEQAQRVMASPDKVRLDAKLQQRKQEADRFLGLVQAGLG